MKHFNYLKAEPLQKLRFRNHLLGLYLPMESAESLYEQLHEDREHYVSDQNYEMAQCYLDIINDLQILDGLAKQ